MTADRQYRFELPPERIAQRPLAERAASRLLRVAPDGRVLGESRFADLPSLLRPGDLLVVNDSRVLPARLRLRRASGGAVELLLTRPLADGGWLAMARPARRLRDGERLVCAVDPERAVDVVGRDDGGEVVVRAAAGDLVDLAERCGETPLPPYIRRGPDTAPELRALDRERYQTVYADRSGSAAAPTAGLHFDRSLLDRLATMGIGIASVTLHVGPGTFRPPDAADVAARRLHAECFTLPAAVDAAIADCRRRGGRVVAVGTTSLRVLETVRRLGLDAPGADRRTWPEAAGDARPEFAGEAVREGDGWRVSGLSRLFLMPPDRPRAADGLITNFHLPGSSLLMLVAALLGGPEAWRPAYDRALAEGFRFYSYGDAMLVLPAHDATTVESP